MSKAERITTILCAAGAAAVLGALVPGFALAAPTEVTRGSFGASYTLTAAPGTTNDITVSYGVNSKGSPAYLFADSAGLTTPLFASCEGGPTGPVLTCIGPDPEDATAEEDSNLKINAGDGADSVILARGAAAIPPLVSQQINGEDGADVLSGSEQSPGVFTSFIQGGSGNDRLFSAGSHALGGQGGIDKLFAKNGVRNRAINCGPGKNKKESAKRDKNDPKAVSC